jgi:hypothetical protein
MFLWDKWSVWLCFLATSSFRKKFVYVSNWCLWMLKRGLWNQWQILSHHLLTHIQTQTNFIKQYLLIRSVTTKLPCLLMNWKVHYLVHKSQLLIPVQRQINLVRIHPPYFFKIRFNTIISSTPRSSKRCLLIQIHMHLWYLPCVLYLQSISSSLILSSNLMYGARSSVVGWGAMLQAGRSRVRFSMRSLDFSIYLILPPSLWPWSQLSL